MSHSEQRNAVFNHICQTTHLHCHVKMQIYIFEIGWSLTLTAGRGMRQRGLRGCGVRSTAQRVSARQQSRAAVIVNKAKTTPSVASIAHIHTHKNTHTDTQCDILLNCAIEIFLLN